MCVVRRIMPIVWDELLGVPEPDIAIGHDRCCLYIHAAMATALPAFTGGDHFIVEQCSAIIFNFPWLKFSATTIRVRNILFQSSSKTCVVQRPWMNDVGLSSQLALAVND